MAFLSSYKHNKGLYQFIIRTAIVFSVLLGAYLFVFLYFRHTQFFLNYLDIDNRYYLPFLSGLRKTDFLNSALFTAIIFLIWNRDHIKTLHPYKQDWKKTAFFAMLAAWSQVFHYLFKYYVMTSQSLPPDGVIIFLKYSFNVIFAVFVVLAAYGLPFIREQSRLLWKQLPVFGLLLVFYYLLIRFFQRIWIYLGNFVGHALYVMLDLTFDNVILNTYATRGPRLGVEGFVVGISNACSGIDSLLLFLSIYIALLVLDWNRMNKKRMLLLLVPGIIGTVIYNLIRVYLIMLIGIFISPKFAIDMFHTNIGWVLFLLFFMLFWHFGSKWVYTKEPPKHETHKKK